MKQVYEIFKQIEETSSKNDKVQIIKDNADNKKFKEYLKFLYDDMITTGLSTKKINKKIKIDGVETIRGFDDDLSVMEFLTNHNTGTDKIILAIQNYLNLLDEPYREFMKKVLSKSYKCGITKSSVNKALGKGFIRDFKVQLAHSYDKFTDRVDEFFLTQKLDGHRTLVKIDENHNVTFRTRKGHEVLGLNQITEDIKKIVTVGSSGAVILDGEITIADESVANDKIFQETSKLLRKDGDKVGLRFNVFDVLPYGEFLEGKSTQQYSERRNALDYLFSKNSVETPYLTLVPVIYQGKDKEVIPELLKQYTDLGHEGLMLNNAKGFYQTKRTPDLLKIKSFFSCDGIVKDIFEGSGKYEGMLGGIYITFEDQVVRVGSGFTDDERKLYWDNPETIIGSVGEYQYFEQTTNQKGGTDLRFATWKSLRDDKNVEDINYE